MTSPDAGSGSGNGAPEEEEEKITERAAYEEPEPEQVVN